MFTRVDHSAISVKDMEKAIAFYTDIVGAEKAMDREFDMSVLVGIPNAKARIVHMRLGDTVIELFHYQPAGRPARPDATQADLGMIHIGLAVEDFQGTFKRLKEKGIKFLGEPFEIRPGVFVAYFHGAESEVCEMREILKK